jgi:hypothetical protein
MLVAGIEASTAREENQPMIPALIVVTAKQVTAATVIFIRKLNVVRSPGSLVDIIFLLQATAKSRGQ